MRCPVTKFPKIKMNKPDSYLNPKEFWKAVLADIQIAHKNADTAYGSLLNKTSVEKLSENEIDISCPDAFHKRNVEKKLLNTIQQSVNKIAKKQLKINVVVTKKDRSVPKETTLGPLFQPERGRNEVIREKMEKSGLVPRFTFEQYVLGKSNQLAYAIATAVAERPGEVYNPVFIYSGVGLGKTHLIHAIGNQILKTKPTLKVVYTTGESFTNELIESIQSGKGRGKYTSNEFRNKFRKTDVLLIDDIQFIAGREATQEEFFHTFNALYMSQKQIVITSDRPPKDFQNIAERITSRFYSGIIADIQPPDMEMRVAILRNKRDQNNDAIPNPVIDFIAERVTTNIRELEGAYLRVLTFAKTTGSEITLEFTAQTLGQTIKEALAKPVNINQILKAVCNYYSVKTSDIKGKRRTKELVIPRQVAMYLIKDLTQIPFMTIGEFLGGRDHTTIMHGVRKIEEELVQYPKTKQDVTNVKQIIFSQ